MKGIEVESWKRSSEHVASSAGKAWATKVGAGSCVETGSSGFMDGVGDDTEGLSAGALRERLRAEWVRVYSARRLYVTLNEAGLCMPELTLFLLEEAAGRGCAPERVREAAAFELDFERFMHATWLLGEREACDLVRVVYPLPPTSVPRMSGYLVGRTKLVDHRSPRAVPNARVRGIRLEDLD